MPTTDNPDEPLPLHHFFLCVELLGKENDNGLRQNDLLIVEDRETVYVYRISDDDLEEIIDLPAGDMNVVDARGDLLGWIDENEVEDRVYSLLS